MTPELRQPFFSVIIPTFRRPLQLASCLTALTRASYPKDRFEVVVVDDGGGDAHQVALPFQSVLNLKTVERENGGPAAARNTGSSEARGEFLAFTDDDCEPLEDWLEALAARCAAVPDHAVGGGLLNGCLDNLCAAASQLIFDCIYDHYNASPSRPRFFLTANLALRADQFRDVGAFDPSFRAGEDREFCDRWQLRGLSMTYAPEARVIHAHALTLQSFWSQHFDNGRAAFLFHRTRRQRNSSRFTPSAGFYARLLSRSFTHPGVSRRLAMETLVVLSQLAIVAGCVAELKSHP